MASSPSASSQKTQPVCSSAWAMYSSRHGAQRGFGMRRFYHRARLGPVEFVDCGPMSYALKLAAVAIGFLLVGALGIVIFSRIWYRVGFFAALLIVFGGLLLLVWNVDRKDKAKRAGLDELPPV